MGRTAVVIACVMVVPPAVVMLAGTPAPRSPFSFDPASFAAKAPPRPSDWLAVHREPHETFDQYVAKRPAGTTAERRAIVLQPLGPFAPGDTDVLATLRVYLLTYFQIEARVAPNLPLPTGGTRKREQPDGTTVVQHHTRVLLEEVLAPRLPADAVCYLGITMADLYPDPDWNFVFGMAHMQRRVGVYSLARYGPGFNGAPDTPVTRQLATRRALLAVAHETAHMFSLPHCTANECLMNGMNSLDELDRSTYWLCPNCLRKLHWNTQLDVHRHYRELLGFFRGREMTEAVAWLEQRIARIGP